MQKNNVATIFSEIQLAVNYSTGHLFGPWWCCKRIFL